MSYFQSQIVGIVQEQVHSVMKMNKQGIIVISTKKVFVVVIVVFMMVIVMHHSPMLMIIWELDILKERMVSQLNMFEVCQNGIGHYLLVCNLHYIYVHFSVHLFFVINKRKTKNEYKRVQTHNNLIRIDYVIQAFIMMRGSK